MRIENGEWAQWATSCRSRNVVKVLKSRRVRWAGYAGRRSGFKMLIGIENNNFMEP